MEPRDIVEDIAVCPTQLPVQINDESLRVQITLRSVAYL